jgi:hypothetical protein
MYTKKNRISQRFPNFFVEKMTLLSEKKHCAAQPKNLDKPKEQ